MARILLLLGVHLIASMQFSKAGEFNTDYIGRSDSGAVKGVFVALIFMSHFSQYITEGPYDAVYRLFQNGRADRFLFISSVYVVVHG